MDSKTIHCDQHSVFIINTESVVKNKSSRASRAVFIEHNMLFWVQEISEVINVWSLLSILSNFQLLNEIEHAR